MARATPHLSAALYASNGGQLSYPILYIFSGLPASGKSTLAKLLAAKVGATYVRIDTVEQGLRDLCNFKVEGEGYRLSYRIIRDNLDLVSVVSQTLVILSSLHDVNGSKLQKVWGLNSSILKLVAQIAVNTNNESSVVEVK